MSRPYPTLPPGYSLVSPQDEVQPGITLPQPEMPTLPPGYSLVSPQDEIQPVVQAPQTEALSLPPGYSLVSPTATGAQRFPGRTQEPEISKVGKVIQSLDYLGGKGRGLVRGALGGDPSDTASFGREFSDPESPLGFLAPGGGLIPEIAEDQGRFATLGMKAPSFTLGLAADILADPLTYVTMGTAGAARAAASRAAKLGSQKTGGLYGTVRTLPPTPALQKEISRLQNIGEQGGVLKFAGLPIPGSRAAGAALGRAAEATVPARRWLGESKYGGPLREVFTTAPLPGSSQALREIYEQGKTVRFLTETQKKEALREAKDIYNLQETIYKTHKDIGREDVNRILTDLVEKKDKGAFTFPEAQMADDPLISSPEIQQLTKGRERLLEDANVQDLVKQVRKVQRDILKRERIERVQTGMLGGRRQAIINAEQKKIDEGALSTTQLANAEAKIAQQRQLAMTDPDYIMHGMTDKAMQEFASLNKVLLPRGSKEFSTEHASQIARKLGSDAENYPTIAQLNAAGRRGELKAFQNKKLDYDVFETDPLRLTIERQLRGIPKIENARFLNQVVAKYGQRAKDIINDPRFLDKSDDYGWMRLRDPETNEIDTLWKSTTAKGFNDEDVYFPREVRDHLDLVHKTANDPNAIGAFGKVFDTLQGYWKGKTLAMFPAYHARNVVGNIWNNFLGGVKSHEPYVRAREIQAGQKGIVTTRGGTQYSYDDIRRLGKEYGVENQGWYSADLERKMQQVDVDDMGWRELWSKANDAGWRLGGYPTLLNPLSASGDDLLNIYGRRTGRYFENNARYAHFVHKLRDGLTPQEAAADVMKYLFDYGDISRVGQKSLGRLFPFFRWTRFNLPLQVEALFKQPGKFSSLVHAKNVIEADPQNPDVDDAVLAPFIRDAFNIQVRRDPKDGDKAEFFILNNWIPAADLVNIIPERAGEELVRMTTPLLKTLVEQGFNYDLFRNREIERDTGELGEFLTLPMRRRTIHLLRNVRLFTEIDRLVSSSEFQEMIGGDVKPEDAGLAENLLRTISGIKLYGVDVNLSRRIQGSLRRQGIRGLESLLRGAQRRGDTDEAKRIIEKLRDLRQ